MTPINASILGSNSSRNLSVVFWTVSKISNPNHLTTEDLPLTHPEPLSSPLHLHTKYFQLEPCTPLQHGWKCNRPNHSSCCIKGWMKQNLYLDMQTIWALLSPKCLRLPRSQIELMDLHKIMLQPLLSLPVRFETVLPKNRTFLVSSFNMGTLGHNWKPNLSRPGLNGRVMTDRRQKKKMKHKGK